MPYDPTLYEGAAIHYRRGRPAYSPALEALLTVELGLDGTGRLLDVGCGPGMLTVRLADLFEHTVGLDPDPAMLIEGRRAAGARPLADISWIQAHAEVLPEAAPGPYRVVTFGQSFHWTEQASVAATVHDLLEPAGALVLVAHSTRGRPVPPGPGPPAIPHAEIQAVVERYLGSTRRAGQGLSPVRGHRFEDVLADARFEDVHTTYAPGIPDLVRDRDSVLAGYFSTAFSAPHLFGDWVEDFRRDVRDLLDGVSPGGVFWDWPGDTEVVMARRPG